MQASRHGNISRGAMNIVAPGPKNVRSVPRLVQTFVGNWAMMPETYRPHAWVGCPSPHFQCTCTRKRPGNISKPLT